MQWRIRFDLIVLPRAVAGRTCSGRRGCDEKIAVRGPAQSVSLPREDASLVDVLPPCGMDEESSSPSFLDDGAQPASHVVGTRDLPQHEQAKFVPERECI